MSPSRKSGRRAPAPDQHFSIPIAPKNTLPPESPTTVTLKTLMDLKESFGAMQSDIRKLSESVKEIKDKQTELDKSFSAIKTVVKTVTAVIALIGGVFGIARYFS